MSRLGARLRDLIAVTGPMPVSDFMTHALYDPMDGYYRTRAAIGSSGDFITAPEVSQVFGELIGLWCVQSWQDMGAPARVDVIELGPGRGVLMADALRAASKVSPGFRAAARVRLIEVNPVLRAAQSTRLSSLGDVDWVTSLTEIAPGASLILGNEFLDCLAIRQFVRTAQGWRERLVGVGDDGGLAFGLAATITPDALIPQRLASAPQGAVVEVAPGLAGVVDQIAERFRDHPGRALFLDYGPFDSELGDTLQALRAHEKRPPLESPGEADLTAHVDFGALQRLARASGLDVAGPVTQGQFLGALGIDIRAGALARAHPHRQEEIAAGVARLTGHEEMGALFKAICLSQRGLPPAAGF